MKNLLSFSINNSVKIYIVGVPIDITIEDTASVDEFKEILNFAHKYSLEIFAAADKDYFSLFTPDGWHIIEEMGIKVNYVKISDLPRQESLHHLAKYIVEQTSKKKTPTIFLRPGDPELGDVPVEEIKHAFKNNPEKIKVIRFRSGPDIIGDYAEKEFGLRKYLRKHFSAKQFLRSANTNELSKRLVIVRSLSSVYDDNKIGLFEMVLKKMSQIGVKEFYIKSPDSIGRLIPIDKAFENMSKFSMESHRTVAFYIR